MTTATSGTGAQTAVPDSTLINAPYTTASSDITPYYFGARLRVGTRIRPPSLTCPRGSADLYTTSLASDGNKQLKKPVALLTADEIVLAGSGWSPSTPNHANSYLRSGMTFWTMSPDSRGVDGSVGGVIIYQSGGMTASNVSNNSWGIRPSISLSNSTTVIGGTGVANDPWIVNQR